MPGGTRSQLGNELFGQMIYVPAVTYPTLAGNATGDNTLSVPGVLPGDLMSWGMQAPPAHIIMDNVYCSAANVLTIRWSTDAAGISTGTIGVIFEILRAENSSNGLSNLPTSLS